MGGEGVGWLFVDIEIETTLLFCNLVLYVYEPVCGVLLGAALSVCEYFFFGYIGDVDVVVFAPFFLATIVDV